MNTIEIDNKDLVQVYGPTNSWHISPKGVRIVGNGMETPAEFVSNQEKITIVLSNDLSFKHKLELLLPLISAPKELRVGSTGYPEYDGTVNKTFGRFYDVFGRLWAIVEDQLIFQRYSWPGSYRFGRLNKCIGNSMSEKDQNEFIRKAEKYSPVK